MPNGETYDTDLLQIDFTQSTVKTNALGSKNEKIINQKGLGDMNPAHKIIVFAFEQSTELPDYERKDLYLAMAELLQGDESEKLRNLANTLGSQMRQTEELQYKLRLGS